MCKRPVTRREFVLGSAATLLATRIHAQAGSVTAQQLVDRIRSSVVPWRTTTVDGIKAIRRRSSRSRDDGHGHDGCAAPPPPPIRISSSRRSRCSIRPRTFPATARPIRCICEEETDRRSEARRLSLLDHWSARQPSESAQALAATFGWKASPPDSDQVYQVPETTLGALTAQYAASPAFAVAFAW